MSDKFKGCDVCRIWQMAHPAGCQRPSPVKLVSDGSVEPPTGVTVTLNDTTRDLIAAETLGVFGATAMNIRQMVDFPSQFKVLAWLPSRREYAVWYWTRRSGLMCGTYFPETAFKPVWASYTKGN